MCHMMHAFMHHSFLHQIVLRTCNTRAVHAYRSIHTSACLSAPVRPRRALLYMPGSSPKMLTKATTLDVDTVCMDLEGMF